MDTREELRDELIAVLAAARELSPDTDRHLADAFAERVEQRRVARPVRAKSGLRLPSGWSWRPRRTVALAMAGLALVIGVPVSVHAIDPTAQAQTVCTKDTYFPVLYHSRAAYRKAAAGMEAKNNHLAMDKKVHIPGYAYSVIAFWDHTNCSPRV